MRESRGLPKSSGRDSTNRAANKLAQNSRKKVEDRQQRMVLASDKDRLDRWNRGEIPILTTPADIRDRFVPGIDVVMMSPERIAEIKRAEFRMKASEGARYVVYVSEDGRLYGQVRGERDGDFPVVRLVPREEFEASRPADKPGDDDPRAGMPRFGSREPAAPKPGTPRRSTKPADPTRDLLPAKIAEAHEFVRVMDLKNNPERRPRKLAALAALKKAQDDVREGRSPKENLAAATEELDALSALGIKMPANAERLKSAMRAIEEAKRLAE
jgi:hypothetical protein